MSQGPDRSLRLLLTIAVGGAIGSLARWGLAQWWPVGPGSFPWATFSANVLGGFLLGVLVVVIVEVWPNQRYVRPFLGVGVLGGFTTFSAYALDARTLAAQGFAGTAVLYVAATLVAGLLAVFCGLTLTRRLVAR